MDDFRSVQGYKEGGIALTDQTIITKYRSAYKYLIGEVGKALLSGQFNLTTVSLPIYAMAPQSILQVISNMGTICPYYFRQAALNSSNPIERMKFVIVATLAFLEPTHHWDKPLNPVLGETLQATSADGG
jgi:hypothetical protein